MPSRRRDAGLSKVLPPTPAFCSPAKLRTGKDLAARAIHRRSQRSSRSFVNFSASIPCDLIVSELFGHEKGAAIVVAWPNKLSSSKRNRCAIPVQMSKFLMPNSEEGIAFNVFWE